MWADRSSAAGCPAAERREAHSSHLWTEGESVPTSEALSRMSMGSSALLSGTDLLRLGEGFSGSAGDSEPHRICAAVRQAVSGGMLAMRRALERRRRSRCAPVVGRGRRRWPQTPLELAESHHKGWRLAGTPLSPLGKWRRGYGIKRPPCGFTFPKEVEADT